MRSWRVDRLGDEITWGWKFCSLYAFWSDYNYQKSQQNPAFWLAVNLALALAYALIIALVVDAFIKWRKGRARAGHS
jgi:hypothetical protein